MMRNIKARTYGDVTRDDSLELGLQSEKLSILQTLIKRSGS